MTSKDNLIQIPAQRYFSTEDLCHIVGISRKQFEAWQRDHGLLGFGGEHYTRLDVVKIAQLKSTFAPYVDAFTHNFVDEAGEPALDAIAVQTQLTAMLAQIDKVLTISAMAEENTAAN
ncbi:hypothetical protein LVJ82_14075 [Vitreoscilla massiliensis]|uniref:HTH merR-type domain-containing protein n=1 Tax=Vitreoscilla massiliensis TaxID=1689272 RepID=A0ABY4DZM6_9NEIS|nr:hypothetical protein [Vitreoscilla massiliensis]UOO88580.1 hypothetical protein LVJ82_14075 [Vitreoscilla massiliensis]